MSNLDSINHEQKLYVLKCGEGFSCLGFDVCENWTKKVLAWLQIGPFTVAVKIDFSAPLPSKGTVEAYEFYRKIMEAGRLKNQQTGQRCPALLVSELIGLEGKHVEVVDCYGEVRRFWVGRSTGWLPIHLEIEKRNDDGGGGVTGTPFKSVQVLSGTRKR